MPCLWAKHRMCRSPNDILMANYPIISCGSTRLEGFLLFTEQKGTSYGNVTCWRPLLCSVSPATSLPAECDCQQPANDHLATIRTLSRRDQVRCTLMDTIPSL